MDITDQGSQRADPLSNLEPATDDGEALVTFVKLL
jgi:hypothetical protein